MRGNANNSSDETRANDSTSGTSSMRGVPSIENSCKHSCWTLHFKRGRFLHNAAAKLSRICGGLALCTSFACTTNHTHNASSGAPSRHDTLTRKLPSLLNFEEETFSSGGGANILFGRSLLMRGLSTCATSGSSGPQALHRTNTSSFSSRSMRPGRHVASWSRTQHTSFSSSVVGDANAFNLLTEGSSSSASPLFTRASLSERLTANASPWQSTSDKCLASNTRRQLSKRVLRSFSRKHWITSGGRTSKSGHVTNISMGLPVTSLTSTRAGPAAGGTGPAAGGGGGMRFGGVAAAIVCESFTRCAQVGQHCGALSFMPKDALRSGAARRRGQRLLGRAALFFGLCF